MSRSQNPLAWFFGVIARGQTYLNLIYVLLAFPLGLAYFIFLTVGLSLGLSLVIVWVGLFVLLVVFAGWWLIAAFERQLAIGLLHEVIPPMSPEQPANQGVWATFVSYLKNPVTWMSLLYLVLKFPVGLFSFVVAVTLIALSASLLAAPLIMPFFPLRIEWTSSQVILIDTLGEALVATLVGVLLVFVTLHAINGIAWISGKLARFLLGNPAFVAAPRLPVPPPAPVTPVTPVAPAEPIIPVAPEKPSEPIEPVVDSAPAPHAG